MENQKVDNQLNLAISATPEERNKSMDLDVGYKEEERSWDLIVKYAGDIAELQGYTISITPLLNQYAVVRIGQSRIDAFANLPQIEYVEKPKRLFFALNQAKAVSCFSAVQSAPYNLRGQGILVACVDSGIDYTHPDFRNSDGTTRIAALWDQTIDGNPPQGYAIGTEYTREQINEALQNTAAGNPGANGSSQVNRFLVPSVDTSGHGTAVMGIAAGNGRSSSGMYAGVASESDLLVVKLGTPLPDSFPRTTELIQGIDYCIRQSIHRNQPLALNISFGNSYGSHEGNSLVETYLNQVSNLGRTTICVGTGNEGSTAGHASGRIANYESMDIDLAVGQYQTSFNIQIWKNYVDEIRVEFLDPSGQRVGYLDDRGGTSRYRIGDTDLLVYYGLPNPYSTAQEIYVDLLPVGDYIESGIWTIRLKAGRIVDGAFDLYLPGGGILNSDTRFYRPSPENTLTIPSAASGVISVGAYNSRLQSYADFSGRGYTRVTNQIKPDLAAPGVSITAPRSGGGYAAYTGTSFATPFVTGASALLMEWGILHGNSPYLYGQAAKASLRKGARQIGGFTTWPNPEMGYGALCVRESLPI